MTIGMLYDIIFIEGALRSLIRKQVSILHERVAVISEQIYAVLPQIPFVIG